MVNFLYIFKKYDDNTSVYVNFFSSGNWGQTDIFSFNVENKKWE